MTEEYSYARDLVEKMSLRSVQQVAEYLGVSRTTIKRMIESGELRAIPLSRGKRKTVYRIRAEVLERWIMVREREHARTLNQNQRHRRKVKTAYSNGYDTPTVPPQSGHDV